MIAIEQNGIQELLLVLYVYYASPILDLPFNFPS